MKTETDPHGKSPHEPGAKLDAGKNRLWLVLGGFHRALKAVGEIGTAGAAKYSDDGWKAVEDGPARYMDAALRHLLDSLDAEFDPSSGSLHLAHAAWNVLAVLELRLGAQPSRLEAPRTSPHEAFLELRRHCPSLEVAVRDTGVRRRCAHALGDTYCEEFSCPRLGELVARAEPTP